ncbi:hypothetical protein N7528_009299 [Penicillium herquei]|nr:hypothetical protein N7528_009299 [Penicillium herquei]
MTTDSLETTIVERFFLNLTIQDVLNNAAEMGFVEPWASMYVSAIREKRYGDAIWARYRILGDTESDSDGYIKGTGLTVTDRIEFDAVKARVDEPELYVECMAFYENASEADGHPDITELIGLIGQAPYET